MKVLVTGGTGFIGPRIVAALRERDAEVRVLVRTPARTARAERAETAAGDVSDLASLKAAAAGCTQVVHLVSIIRGRAEDYERVMVEGTRNAIEAARDAGVERFVLMSAIGADEANRNVATYYAAKLQMEQDVARSGLEHTIFRPSFVFGDGGVLPTFISQVKLTPLIPVIGSGEQRIQPIWVDDVAAYFARGVDLPEAANRSFDLGGPDVVTWNELYRTIARVLGKRRRLVHIPSSLASTGARLTQSVPGAPVTVDQIAMIEAGDNVATRTDAVDTFRLPLVRLEEQIRRVAS